MIARAFAQDGGAPSLTYMVAPRSDHAKNHDANATTDDSEASEDDEAPEAQEEQQRATDAEDAKKEHLRALKRASKKRRKEDPVKAKKIKEQKNAQRRRKRQKDAHVNTGLSGGAPTIDAPLSLAPPPESRAAPLGSAAAAFWVSQPATLPAAGWVDDIAMPLPSGMFFEAEEILQTPGRVARFGSVPGSATSSAAGSMSLSDLFVFAASAASAAGAAAVASAAKEGAKEGAKEAATEGAAAAVENLSEKMDCGFAAAASSRAQLASQLSAVQQTATDTLGVARQTLEVSQGSARALAEHRREASARHRAKLRDQLQQAEDAAHEHYQGSADALPELPSYWNSSVIMILKLIELGIGAGKLW